MRIVLGCVVAFALSSGACKSRSFVPKSSGLNSSFITSQGAGVVGRLVFSVDSARNEPLKFDQVLGFDSFVRAANEDFKPNPAPKTLDELIQKFRGAGFAPNSDGSVYFELLSGALPAVNAAGKSSSGRPLYLLDWKPKRADHAAASVKVDFKSTKDAQTWFVEKGMPGAYRLGEHVVSPLQSLAGHRLLNDMIVKIPNPQVSGDRIVTQDPPIQVSGAETVVVKFKKPSDENYARGVISAQVFQEGKFSDSSVDFRFPPSYAEWKKKSNASQQEYIKEMANLFPYLPSSLYAPIQKANIEDAESAQPQSTLFRIWETEENLGLGWQLVGFKGTESSQVPESFLIQSIVPRSLLVVNNSAFSKDGTAALRSVNEEMQRSQRKFLLPEWTRYLEGSDRKQESFARLSKNLTGGKSGAKGGEVSLNASYAENWHFLDSYLWDPQRLRGMSMQDAKIAKVFLGPQGTTFEGTMGAPQKEFLVVNLFGWFGFLSTKQDEAKSFSARFRSRMQDFLAKPGAGDDWVISSERDTPLRSGHISLGKAKVIPHAVTGEPSWDVTYFQMYGLNGEHVIASSMDWSHYIGNLHRGWGFLRPVADVLIDYPPLFQEFGAQKARPIDYINDSAERIMSYYRVGGGDGTAVISSTNSCAQDTIQSFYSGLRAFLSDVYQVQDSAKLFDDLRDTDDLSLGFRPEFAAIANDVAAQQSLKDLLGFASGRRGGAMPAGTGWGDENLQDMFFKNGPANQVRPDWLANYDNKKQFTVPLRFPEILVATVRSANSVLPANVARRLIELFAVRSAPMVSLQFSQFGGVYPKHLPINLFYLKQGSKEYEKNVTVDPGEIERAKPLWF